MRSSFIYVCPLYPSFTVHEIHLKILEVVRDHQQDMRLINRGILETESLETIGYYHYNHIIIIVLVIIRNPTTTTHIEWPYTSHIYITCPIRCTHEKTMQSPSLGHIKNEFNRPRHCLLVTIG